MSDGFAIDTDEARRHVESVPLQEEFVVQANAQG
jgi:hypothetical protein